MNAAANVADRGTEALDEVADGLAIAYLRLARAAAINQHLAAIDSDYQGQASWDVALAVHEAITDIEDTARIHDLAERHDFWKEPEAAATVAAANVYATSPQLSDIAADQLMDHLGAALEVLLNVSLHTSDDKIGDALRAVCTALEALVTSSAVDFELNQP